MSIERHQQQIGEWQRAIIPIELNTPRHHFNRSLEEMVELHDAISVDDGSPQAKEGINMEATDVIIRMMGIIVATGGNVVELLDRKIGIMQEKYPPARIQGDLRQGVPFDLAMANSKRAYNPQG